MKIDLTDMNKAEVLATLYNNAKPQGLGVFEYTEGPMGIEEAEKLLENEDYPYFDYLKGRVLKIDFSENPMDTTLYDRDNYPHAADVLKNLQGFKSV